MAGIIAGSTGWIRKLLAFVLVVVIVVCATLVVFVTLNKAWAVTTQVGLAVAGAALGAVLQVDAGKTVVENQVRLAIRRHFDRGAQLRVLVQRVENFAVDLSQIPPDRIELALSIAHVQIDEIAFHLRSEIDSTATAIEEWGDLAPRIYEAELIRYRTRSERSPHGPLNEGSG